MFELRHVSGLVRLSLLGTAAALGCTSSFTGAKAEGLPSSLAAPAEQGSLYAQSNDGADKPEAGSAANGEQIEGEVPFSELNEALSAARARLAELTKAAEIAKVAGELRQELEATQAENRQLKAALSQTKSDNADLQTTKQAATRQAEESEKAALEASEEARRLDEELVAMRWQNSQLSTSLARAEAIASSSTEELDKAKSDFASRSETLAADSEEAAAEAARLSKELDVTRESALIAEQRGAELDEQSAQNRVKANKAEAEAAKLAKDLDVTITELGNTRVELTTTREMLEEASISLEAANQETAVLREQFAANRGEADQLRQKLETAEGQIKQVSASNKDLRRQVKVLRTAAGEATDAARLNLIAVENQINEINAALATVKGDEPAAPSGGPALPASNGNVADAEKEANDVWVPKLTPARSTAIEQQQQQLIAAASPAFTAPQQTASNPPAAGSPLAGRVIRTKAGGDEKSTISPTEVAALVDGLSNERRQRAETLLADLNVRSESRGLAVTVPGTILFAVNSEKIEPDAYDTLAKVAEMVDLYKDRAVLIVGHTDAVGNDGYNQKLSERRADLVKNYFIDEFKVEGDRLSAEGQGEKSPITSNATAEGRNANRRIEVILLN